MNLFGSDYKTRHFDSKSLSLHWTLHDIKHNDTQPGTLTEGSVQFVKKIKNIQ